MAAEIPYVNNGVINNGGKVEVPGVVGRGGSVTNIHYHHYTGTSSEPEPEPTSTERALRYSPNTKLEVCKRLHTSWEELSDVMGLEPHTRRAFRRGREAFDLWDWLEERNRLGDLPGALAEIGRYDLVKVLDQDTRK